MEERYKELSEQEVLRIAMHVYDLTSEPAYVIKQNNHIDDEPVFASNFTAALKRVLEEKFDAILVDSESDLYYIPVFAIEPLCRSIEAIKRLVSDIGAERFITPIEEVEFWDEASRIADVLEERLKATINNMKKDDLERQFDFDSLDDETLMEVAQQEEDDYIKREDLRNSYLYDLYGYY